MNNSVRSQSGFFQTVSKLTLNILIVAGFQGINKFDDITTLGRGGSDTSAVALAVALKAEKCQIFTDVDGQMYLSFHSPNSTIDGRREKPVFLAIEEKNGKLVWADKNSQ